MPSPIRRLERWPRFTNIQYIGGEPPLPENARPRPQALTPGKTYQVVEHTVEVGKVSVVVGTYPNAWFYPDTYFRRVNTETTLSERIEALQHFMLIHPEALYHKGGGIYLPRNEPFTWKGEGPHDGIHADTYIHLWPHAPSTYGRPVSELAPPRYVPIAEALEECKSKLLKSIQ